MNAFVYFFAFVVCGANALSTLDGASRITNGNLATENQFPYMVSLQKTQPAEEQTETRGHRCGGVLVTHQHVVTAASCLYDVDLEDGSSSLINVGDYRIFGGSSLLSNDSANRIRMITNVTIHPNYKPSPAFVNNIAIILLNQPFANTTVTPLRVFANASTFNPEDFARCTVAGWGGYNPTDTASPQLRFANKYIYNQNLCTWLYNSVKNTLNILPTMVCATSFDIISVGCTGDVGNPLVCDNMLTGILFGYSACVPTSHPEIYTRVSDYADWIRDIIGSRASTLSQGVYMVVLLAILQIIKSSVIS